MVFELHSELTQATCGFQATSELTPSPLEWTQEMTVKKPLIYAVLSEIKKSV